jgi:hypothetical protein
LIAAALAAAFFAGLVVGRDRTPARVTKAASAKPVEQTVPVSGQKTLEPVPILPGIRLDPHDLDFTELVPSDGVVDSAWFVPAGRGELQVAVAWHRGTARSGEDTRLWNLTLWNPEGISGRRWVPYRLIVASPYPIRDSIGRSGVKLADVTGDGHADLLVSVGIVGSNHGASVISVFAMIDGTVRRIYGHGSSEDKFGGRAYGRNITETSWGARHGLLWFDEPRGGKSICCPDYRLKYELRWNGDGWDRVSERRVRQHYG